MSLKTEPPKSYGGPPPPPPPPAYTYASEIDPSRVPPSLPPMSSLLRHDQDQQEAQPYMARQFMPPYNMTKQHPLWLAQADPNSPVLHIYHPPQPPLNSHFVQTSAEPMLVPLQPEHTFAVPSNQGAAPQRRTAKKILQRRQDHPKDQSQERKDSPELSLRYQEQTRGQYDSPESSYSRRESASLPSPIDPSMRRMSSQSQGSRSMPISGLLSDAPDPVNQRPSPKYTLRMRQQPIAARACGFGERDRRVIDPPPILQMSVEDPNSSPEELRALIRQPYSVVHCVLWDPVKDQDDTAMPGTTDKRQQRRLMGTLVASPFVGNDEHGVEGCFFTFPDLSVRTPGTYSLKFSLINLDPSRMMPGSREPVKSVVKSSVFHVYNAKDFGGMRASTELTKTLKHQGCLISVKKGNNKPSGSRARDDEEDDEDDDEDDDGDRSTSIKRGKRPKR